GECVAVGGRGKPLWAPLVDRFGTRKQWIVPLTALLGGACAAAAFARPDAPGGLTALLWLILLMNFFAATQDIAVDGLAVDLLGARELGAGNAAQVVGYKVGMLTAGGVLVGLSDDIGWAGLLAARAALCAVGILATTAVDEPRRSYRERDSLADIGRAIVRALREPDSLVLLAFLVSYKTGESMIDAMWKPFLVDAGFSTKYIGWVNGTLGMAASIAGSLAGGWLASAMRPQRAPWVPAIGRIVPPARPA